VFESIVRGVASIGLLIRQASGWSRHPGESRGPGGEPPPLLDSGFRRNDGDFMHHRIESIVRISSMPTLPVP